MKINDSVAEIKSNDVNDKENLNISFKKDSTEFNTKN